MDELVTRCDKDMTTAISGTTDNLVGWRQGNGIAVAECDFMTCLDM